MNLYVANMESFLKHYPRMYFTYTVVKLLIITVDLASTLVEINNRIEL